MSGNQRTFAVFIAKSNFARPNVMAHYRLNSCVAHGPAYPRYRRNQRLYPVTQVLGSTADFADCADTSDERGRRTYFEDLSRKVMIVDDLVLADAKVV